MKKILILAVVALTAISMAQPGGGRAQRGGARGNQNSMTSLLSRTDVQGELKITDEQKTKLAELQPARGQRGAGGSRRNGNRAAGGNGAGSFDPSAVQAAMLEREKKVLDLLSPEQAKRLKELYVQKAGNRVILRADFQKDLGLSDDQVAKVKALQTKQAEAVRSIMQKVQNGEIDRTEVASLQEKNQKILSDELGKILTADQTAKLKTMGGTPFKFEDAAPVGGQ